MSLLLVPVVLAIGGVAFAFVQDSRQQDLEHRRAQADALQAYLDQMSTLLIDEAPKTVIEEGDEKNRLPARSHRDHGGPCPNVDHPRESGLRSSKAHGPGAEEDRTTVPLRGTPHPEGPAVVELRDANLEQSNLETMVMPHANLSGARLVFADLSDADLSDARLDENV